MIPPSPQTEEFAKAVAFHRAGQLADAERICHAILAADQLHFGAKYLLGIIALQRGQFQTAEQQIALALELNPNAAPAHRDRGIALAHLGRHVEALASLDRAIALSPKGAPSYFYFNRGGAKDAKGDHDGAIADFDRAIELDPNAVGVYYSRALARSMKGDHEGAIADLNRAVALKPNFAKAYYGRSAEKKALGDRDGAIADYERAKTLGSNPR